MTKFGDAIAVSQFEVDGIQPPEIRGEPMSETALAIASIDGLSEKRLWQAVLLTTIQEWIGGPLRRKRQAEEYLFQDQKDFQAVCQSAGMDPERLRAKLKRLRPRSPEPSANGRSEPADFGKTHQL